MNKVSTIIYAIVGVLLGYFCYQYTDISIYLVGIALSFILVNFIVLYLYRSFRHKPLALMKFMGINFLKDILWAIFWLFLIRGNAILAIFVAMSFFLLSIPLYLFVLKDVGNNQKSDKNQS